MLQVEVSSQPRPEGRRRIGIEGIRLGLHRPAGAGEAEAPEALGHEAPCAHGAAGGEQVVGALRAQPVRGLEEPVDVARTGLSRTAR